MVPLHNDNMHIHVIDKRFTAEKNDIFQRKNCDIFFFFSNHRQ